MRDFRDRVLIPLLVPLLAMGLIAVVVLNYSRVLLAIEGAPAVFVAMATALALLAGATWFSQRSEIPSARAITVLAVAGVTVVGAGFIGLARLNEERPKPPQAAAGTVQKPGPPDVTIHAVDIGFREKEVTTTAGQIKIAEVNDGQITHTLLLEGVPGFELAVPGHGQEAEDTVTLQPGRYTYYCDIPGHRQAGMEGVLLVTPAVSGQAQAPASGSSLEIKAGDLFLAPKQAQVSAGPFRITYRNTGSIQHTLVADGLPAFKRLVVEPGEEETEVLDVGPGTYTLYCDIAGHRAAGMQLTLTVG